MSTTDDLEYATLDRGTALLPSGDEFDHLPFDLITTEDDVAILGNNNSVQESLDWIAAEGWRHTGPVEMTGTPGDADPDKLMELLRGVRPQIVGLHPRFARFELHRPRRKQ